MSNIPTSTVLYFSAEYENDLEEKVNQIGMWGGILKALSNGYRDASVSGGRVKEIAYFFTDESELNSFKQMVRDLDNRFLFHPIGYTVGR